MGFIIGIRNRSGSTYPVAKRGVSSGLTGPTGPSPTGPAGVGSLDPGGFTPSYGEVENTSTTSVLGGSPANFNVTTGPSAGIVQASGGLTVTATGVYEYEFQVRGTPTNTLVPPAPLIFALHTDAGAQPQTQFASDKQTASLGASETEAVTGQGLLTLVAGTNVTLINQTESGATPQGDVGLAQMPLGGTATVNMKLSLKRVA